MFFTTRWKGKHGEWKGGEGGEGEEEEREEGKGGEGGEQGSKYYRRAVCSAMAPPCEKPPTKISFDLYPSFSRSAIIPAKVEKSNRARSEIGS
jgi:hypothetical protein